MRQQTRGRDDLGLPWYCLRANVLRLSMVLLACLWEEKHCVNSHHFYASATVVHLRISSAHLKQVEMEYMTS